MYINEKPVVALFLLFIACTTQASDLNMPNSFSAGTPAVAAEVNANFNAVTTAVNDNDTRITTLENAIAALQETVDNQAASILALQNALATKANATHGHAQSDITSLVSTLSYHATQLNTHGSQISAINNSYVMDLEPYVRLTSNTQGPLVTLQGVNLRVINGAGSTETINGTGNIIIGYDEVNSLTGGKCSVGGYYPGNLIANWTPALDETTCTAAGGTWSNGTIKTGSHNLVLGTRNTYTQYGSIVSGWGNTVNSKHSSALGGYYNYAIGDRTVVTGGSYNKSVGYVSTASGGSSNNANGYMSSTFGGVVNTSTGAYSNVTGGSNNSAGGERSTVSGGYNRSAPNIYDWRAGSLLEEQ